LWLRVPVNKGRAAEQLAEGTAIPSRAEVFTYSGEQDMKFVISFIVGILAAACLVVAETKTMFDVASNQAW
jgi:hypothetical protein